MSCAEALAVSARQAAATVAPRSSLARDTGAMEEVVVNRAAPIVGAGRCEDHSMVVTALG